MPEFVGHRKVVTLLERRLPPVGLILGPRSVGKQTMTHHLAARHNVAMADRFICPDALTIQVVRAVIDFVNTAPFGPFKLVTARLDCASEPALNALLKTLEEPPPSARFLFTAEKLPLPTVASRCEVYRVGLLATDELTVVLRAQGLSKLRAEQCAAVGRGQVDVAMRAETLDAARANVINVMRAVATSDTELFDKAFKGFDSNARDALMVWFVEAITGQWVLFRQADACGLDRNPVKLRRMLISVGQLRSAQPRLGVRAALEPYLQMP